jgi:curli biogenesis system outer membrane secretion channel CsgG
MKRGLIALLLAVALILVPYGTVMAATTQNIEVTAQPTFISISNSPSSNDFGVVSENSNTSTSQGYFTVTNGSTVAIDCSIGTNASSWDSDGGVNWTHSDTGTAGEDTVGLFSSPNNAAWNIIVKNASPNDIVNDQAAETNWQWELRLVTGTFTDGVVKAIKVVLTATEH